MSKWIDQIRDHMVWAQLQALGPVIDEALLRENIPASAIEDLERVKAILGFCGRRLAALEPLIAVTPPLDTIGNSLASASTAISNYTKTGDVTQLGAANTHASAAVTAASILTPPSTPDELTSIGEAAASYRNSLGGFLTAFEEKFAAAIKTIDDSESRFKEIGTGLEHHEAKAGELSQSLASLSGAINEQATKLTSMLADHEKQFASVQSTRSDSFAASETSRQATFAAATTDQQSKFEAAQNERQNAHAQLVASFQTQFNEAQATRLAEHSAKTSAFQEEFSAAQSERRDNFSAIVSEYETKLKEQDESFSEQSKEALAEHQEHLKTLTARYESEAKGILDLVNDHKVQVEKLIGVIGNAAVTSGYQRTANSARNWKIFWQLIAVVALGALSYFAITRAVGDDLKWESIAAHLMSYLPIIVLAAYAGSQADKLHQTEKRNRKLALEFEAIGPYLAPLPEEMQYKFRVDVGERSFGQHQEDLVKTANEKSPATAVDVASEFGKNGKMLESLTTLVKAIKE